MELVIDKLMYKAYAEATDRWKLKKRINIPSDSLATINPTWSDVGSNPGLQLAMTNCLGWDKALTLITNLTMFI